MTQAPLFVPPPDCGETLGWQPVQAPLGAPAVPYRIQTAPGRAEWYCRKTSEWRPVQDPTLSSALCHAAVTSGT